MRNRVCNRCAYAEPLMGQRADHRWIRRPRAVIKIKECNLNEKREMKVIYNDRDTRIKKRRGE